MGVSKSAEFWLDVSTKEGLKKSLESLILKWTSSNDGQVITDGEELQNFLTRHLWPYLSEDFGKSDPTHSFETP
jgi:hypothetical protein